MSEEVVKETEALAEGVEVKRCSKCGRILPLSMFNKAKNTPDGLRYHCKDCCREYSREHNKVVKEQRVVQSEEGVLKRFLVPTRPNIPEELASKTIGECKPIDLMRALKLWGYSGRLSWTRMVNLDEI